MALTGSSIGFIAGLGRVRLVLELTPQPGPAGGDILAVAVLTTERDQRPFAGEAVRFYLGADEVVAVSTEDDGRAAYSFGGLGFGTHAISVQVAGVHVTVRHAFPPPVAKRLASPNVRAEGDEGNYLISASVTREDGGPAQDVPVRLLISKLGKPGERPDPDPLTNKFGLAEYRLVFTEPEADVTWQVGPYEGKITNLHGPSRWRKPKPYEPMPASELIQGSIRDLIRRAWQRGVARRQG